MDYTTGDLRQTIQSAHPDGVAGVIHLAGEADELGKVVSLVRDGGMVVTPAGASPVEGGRIQWGMFGAEITRGRLTQLAEMVSKGDLKLPPVKAFAFDDISSAFQESSSGHVRGKLVVRVGAAEKPARAMEEPEAVSLETARPWLPGWGAKPHSGRPSSMGWRHTQNVRPLLCRRSPWRRSSG